MTSSTVIAAALLVSASPLMAQRRPEVRHRDQLSPSLRAPYGLCRIWINGFAPIRQPAATGCAYAYANVPRSGRVIYGGERGELFDPYYDSQYDRYYGSGVYGGSARDRNDRYDGDPYLRYDRGRYDRDRSDRDEDDSYNDEYNSDRYAYDRYGSDPYTYDRGNPTRYSSDYYNSDRGSVRNRNGDRYDRHRRSGNDSRAQNRSRSDGSYSRGHTRWK